MAQVLAAERWRCGLRRKTRQSACRTVEFDFNGDAGGLSPTGRFKMRSLLPPHSWRAEPGRGVMLHWRLLGDIEGACEARARQWPRNTAVAISWVRERVGLID